MDNTLQRDTRLDLAKAIAISLVLFWHLQPIRMPITDKSTVLLKVLGFGLNQFNLQITLVAVPVFFLVSVYLFFQKIENSTSDIMSKRCIRIAVVYFFWTVCQFASFYAILYAKYLHSGAGNFAVPLPMHRLIMEGGPPLPIVDGSVFYFLFVLFVLIFVSGIFYSFRDLPKIFFIIGASIATVSILYLETLNLRGRGLPYWRIDNFLIYIPLAYFLLKQEKGRLVKYLPYLYAGYIIFAAQDVYLRYHGYNTGGYSRLSIVFGSMALFSSILQMKYLKGNSGITLLSICSLGIFATHKYWQLITNMAFNYFGFSDPAYAAWFPLDLRALAIAVISILLTFTALMIASRTVIKRYIS